MVFLLIAFGLYFIFVLTLFYGWERAMAEPIKPVEEFRSIAIIVPIRNERRNIDKLLASLLKQNYPKEKFEIILVDDHSTDGSKEVHNDNVNSISLPINLSGKKAAITFGIQNTQSEIIVTTDADCTHHPNWLKSINSSFREKTKLIIGPVVIQSNSFFGKLQTIEFSSLIISGAALTKLDIPAMANGANLAYRKEAFINVNGFEGNEHIASGDDEYLLKKIFGKYPPEEIVFNNNSDSVVETESQPSLSAFIKQRIRWAGKWKYQTNVKVKLITLLVFLFQLTFLYALFLMVQGNQLATILFLGKCAWEGALLWRGSAFFKYRLGMLPFILLELIYPFYVVFIALASLFISVEWKERAV